MTQRCGAATCGAAGRDGRPRLRSARLMTWLLLRSPPHEAMAGHVHGRGVLIDLRVILFLQVKR
jgi:hypothetical protein